MPHKLKWVALYKFFTLEVATSSVATESHDIAAVSSRAMCVWMNRRVVICWGKAQVALGSSGGTRLRRSQTHVSSGLYGTALAYRPAGTLVKANTGARMVRMPHALGPTMDKGHT